MPGPVLPDFPWDTLAPYAQHAREHPSGIIDLSVGTPVDPTPQLVRDALAQASDAPGYPQTWGTPALREAVCTWFERRRATPGVDPDGVLPTIGSKELVAWLPTLLGLGPGDVIAVPAIAYPTYQVGAALARATPRAFDGLTELGPSTPATAPKLLWLNTPCNPTGQVLGLPHLRKVVAWARERGCVVASDECYAELDWRERRDALEGPTTPSVLHPQVTDGDHTGLLAVYSLSKQSSLAGYRAAFVAGDPALVRRILQVRKHAGMMMPAPVQQAMQVALSDQAHVERVKRRYAARRAVLGSALQAAGYRIDHSEAGLYLWASAGRPAWDSVRTLADLGILVAPGAFYGRGGASHVRVALTATDDQIAAAAQRLEAR